MSSILGLFHAFSLVLVVSGTSKLRDPQPAGLAMRTAKIIPGSSASKFKRSIHAARALGLAEVAVGAGALLSANWVSSISLAAVFGGFIWFVLRLSQVDGSASCGCFGSTDAPPGLAHHLFNAAAVVVGVLVALTATNNGGLSSAVSDLGYATGAAYLVALAVAAWLFLTGPTLLAEVSAAKDLRHNTSEGVKTFGVSEGWNRS